MVQAPTPETLYPEIRFQASRSSGAGGQHVNKVNTRIELRFNVMGSMVLSDEQKEVLVQKLSSRISKEGELIIVSEKTRSQYRNKEDSLEKFNQLIVGSFFKEKPRVATKPGYKSRVRRLESKKLHSNKKLNRRKPDM